MTSPPPPPGPPYPPPHRYPYPPPRPAGGGSGKIIAIVAGALAGLLVLCGGAVTVGFIVVDRSGILDGPGEPTGEPGEAVADGPIDWLVPQGSAVELDSLWEELADEFMAAHGGQVRLQQIPNDAYQTQLGNQLHTSDPPDLYHSGGGNRFRRQVEDGLLRDLTDDLADVIATMPAGVLAPYTVDGRVYGLPYDAGAAGIWYDKALFADAGLDPDRPPQTWSDFLAAVRALDDADITPVALAGLEGWTGLLWYGSLAVRVAGVDGLTAAARQRSWTGSPDLRRAADLLAEFVAIEPFQPGYESAAYVGPGGQAELLATGGAAMELSGSWAPTVYESIAPGALGDDLGWFPFPVVEGGRGVASEVYGFVNGLAIGADAPAAAVEFLRFLFGDQSYQRILAADAQLMSVRADARAPVDDPNLGLQVQAVQDAAALQPSLDRDLPPGLAGDLADSMVDLLTGAATPEQVLTRITEAWQAVPDY